MRQIMTMLVTQAYAKFDVAAAAWMSARLQHAALQDLQHGRLLDLWVCICLVMPELVLKLLTWQGHKDVCG